MQAIPGSLQACSHFSHEALHGHEFQEHLPQRKGNASRDTQDGNLHSNASSPVGTWQWAPRISNITLQNDKMQAVVRQQGRAAHEAQQEGPLCVKPGPLRNFPGDDVGHDAPS